MAKIFLNRNSNYLPLVVSGVCWYIPVYVRKLELKSVQLRLLSVHLIHVLVGKEFKESDGEEQRKERYFK